VYVVCLYFKSVRKVRIYVGMRVRDLIYSTDIKKKTMFFIFVTLQCLTTRLHVDPESFGFQVASKSIQMKIYRTTGLPAALY
jgi:hypothetical protein